MWGDGRSKIIERKVNSKESGVNSVSEVKPQLSSSAPTQRALHPGRFEALGQATGIFTNWAAVKVCNKCGTKNPPYTAAVKTMSCIAEVCGFCGRRGQIKKKCFGNPESPCFRFGQEQQPLKPAINAIILAFGMTRPQLRIKHEGRELGITYALLDSGADICIMNDTSAARLSLQVSEITVPLSSWVRQQPIISREFQGKGQPP